MSAWIACTATSIARSGIAAPASPVGPHVQACPVTAGSVELRRPTPARRAARYRQIRLSGAVAAGRGRPSQDSDRANGVGPRTPQVPLGGGWTRGWRKWADQASARGSAPGHRTASSRRRAGGSGAARPAAPGRPRPTRPGRPRHRWPGRRSGGCGPEPGDHAPVLQGPGEGVALEPGQACPEGQVRGLRVLGVQPAQPLDRRGHRELLALQSSCRARVARFRARRPSRSPAPLPAGRRPIWDVGGQDQAA
jgi:hypothetical protein